MSMRTTETTVTFKLPFTLPEFEHPRPAGTYRVVTDEQEISGLSFLAFRRTATMLRLPSLATSGRPEQMIYINAEELAAALKADHENVRGERDAADDGFGDCAFPVPTPGKKRPASRNCQKPSRSKRWTA